MKKVAVVAFAAVALVMGACSNEEKVAEEVVYTLDSAASSLEWTGTYVSDGHTHTGTVAITEGTLTFNGDEFVSGEFTVDLAQLVNTDLEGEQNAYLVGHLKSGDFFDVEKNAKVPVKITAVTDKGMEGTITVLGKEVPATMPLTIKRDEKGFSAEGKFSVDFAATEMGGFKAAEGKPENERVQTTIDFALKLNMKK